MPLTEEVFEAEKPEIRMSDERRIYACEGGDVRIETRRFRQTFSPEEFVALVRGVFRENKSRQMW